MHTIGTPEEMTLKVPKSEPDDLSSLYDLEYRAGEDDAWYNVWVVFDGVAETLTVKYLCDPGVHVSVLHAGDFDTVAKAEELIGRFRQTCRPVQDRQCGELAVGDTVCAAHCVTCVTDNDLRFYDAVIDAVSHKEHSFSDGEEVCPCTFVLFWKHGRGRGTLTSVGIASICTIEPVAWIDRRISAFVKLAKEKIAVSKSIRVFEQLGSPSKGISSGNGNSHVKNLEVEISMMPKSPELRSEDSGRNSNFNERMSQDEDMDRGPRTIVGLVTAESQHCILIHNLEKDLTATSIKRFIHKQTNILPQTFVFPRLLSDPFSRGAITVDCGKKLQVIYEFLDNPNHIIVSSRGRPWVITEKPSGETFRTIWNLMPMALDEIQCKGTEEELKIVQSGTESYKRAKQLKDLFTEYINHDSRLCKKLVLEEEKIRKLFRQA